MSKSKALLFDLSGSISFGRLSLLGKVLFPMLVLKSDDQGRGLAEPDAIKWKACPNVQELTIEAIGGILQEMAEERIDLLHLYQDSRGRQLYQFKRWWVPDIGSGSCLQWARPSEYEAPQGWVDRVRLQQGPGKPPLVENWDTPGGFIESELPNELGNEVPNDGHGGQNNLTKYNPTQTKEKTGANDAPAPDGAIPEPPPEPPKKRKTCTKDPPPPAVEVVRSATQLYPTKSLWPGIVEVVGDEQANLDRFKKVCLAWVACGWNKRNVKGMIQHYVEGRIPGDNHGNGRGARASPAAQQEPASWEGLRQWAKEEGITLDGFT